MDGIDRAALRDVPAWDRWQDVRMPVTIDEANAALPTAPHPQPMTSHGGITDRLAASLAADPTAARGTRGWGQVGGAPELRAKSIVEIDGIAPWACGRWYVAAATHRYRAAAGGGPATYATHLAVTR